MNNSIQNYSANIFEDIKHINEYGQEFWYARELQNALEYSQIKPSYSCSIISFSFHQLAISCNQESSETK